MGGHAVQPPSCLAWVICSAISQVKSCTFIFISFFLNLLSGERLFRKRIWVFSLFFLCLRFCLQFLKILQHKLLRSAYLVVRYEKALNKYCRCKQTLSVSVIFNIYLRVIKKRVAGITGFFDFEGGKIIFRLLTFTKYAYKHTLDLSRFDPCVLIFLQWRHDLILAFSPSCLDFRYYSWMLTNIGFNKRSSVQATL